jgi:A/G-specific adenine glycosylase
VQRIKKQKIEEFQSILFDWYKKNGRRFPWRKKRLTHYQIVISEVLLQRTKAETVSIFYSKFIREFPNWKTIANSKLVEIENYLKPIGLYSQKAKRLRKLAIEMIKRNGRLPKDRYKLERIPFLGQYIINAIELIIFNMPSPLIDVNMARLLERYFDKRKMSDIRYDPYLQNLSRKIVNHKNSREINWAILDYAAIICKARNPLCYNCLLNKKCIYYKNQHVDEFIVNTRGLGGTKKIYIH